MRYICPSCKRVKIRMDEEPSPKCPTCKERMAREDAPQGLPVNHGRKRKAKSGAASPQVPMAAPAGQ